MRIHGLNMWIVVCAVVTDAAAMDLQAVLDGGGDLLLEPGRVYEVGETLRVTTPNQKIATRDARQIGDFATLRITSDTTGTVIDAAGTPGVTIERLILDGNRYGMLTPDGSAPHEPLLSLGREGGDNQAVRQCVLLNSRSRGGWGAIHFHENGNSNLIEDNIVFGAGVDVLGNGRSGHERPFGYGDGISTTSRNTLVRNNLVIDATDEGIMVQGAPGTRVESNMIAAVSREMLGGIALIDPSFHYAIDTDQRIHDYRGVIVRNNIVDAFGARIHIAFPMGGPVWNDRAQGTTLVGAQVLDNRVAGGAAAYGFAAAGIDAFTVRGNRSDARYSGAGDGMHQNPPDPPAAFLFDPESVGTSDLQDDFKPSQRHILHLMRNFWQPSNPLGYRATDYGEAEAEAIVRAAYLEMMGRQPTSDERDRWIRWLQQTKANADSLRRTLMATEEFCARHGYHDPLDLQGFRTGLWMRHLTTEAQRLIEGGGQAWPVATRLYEVTRSAIENDDGD